MDKEDKQSIRAEEYEEQVKYAPGWPPQPQPSASIDPQLMTDLSDVKVTKQGWVHVLMSLTSAFCPAADTIPLDVQQKIESIPNLKCKVKITMQPQWGRDMINPEIRDLMGL